MILTNAKEIKMNPYYRFITTNTQAIYDIYKELLGEYVWRPTISSPEPLKIDTIGRNIFKSHTNK